MTSETKTGRDEKTADRQADRPPKHPPAVASKRPAKAKSRKPEDVFRRRRGWLAALVVIAAGGAVCALTWLPARKKDEPTAKRSLTNVTVQTVIATDVPDTLDLPGVVEPNRTVTVSARVGGQVTKVSRVDNRTEGRPCTRGETIVVLDTELLQVRIDQANAQIAQYTAEIAQAAAQRDLARTERDSVKGLHAKGAATDFTLQQAEDALTAAEAGIKRAEAGLTGANAALKAAEVDMSYAEITAPINGVLDEMMVEEGELVAPGTPVAKIVDTATVRVAIDVPQSDVRWIMLGSGNMPAVQLGFAGESGGPTFSGTVDYISELADLRAKTTRVEVLVKNTPRKLRSGQIVRVALRRRVLPQAIMVPLEAVIQLEDGRAVYVVDAEDKAERRIVTLGRWRGRNVQIRSGLRAGDRLITQGHRYVAPGQPVNVQGDKATTRPAATIVSSDPTGRGRS